MSIKNEEVSLKPNEVYLLDEFYSTLVKKDCNGIRHNTPNVRIGKWEINSLGFRGKEVHLEKQEGGIRIVCIGGSETFGIFETKGKEWPFQLGETLRDRLPAVEVINASVIGLPTRKRKEYVERYVLPSAPDIMIIFHQRFLEPTRFSEYVKDPMKKVRHGSMTDKVNLSTFRPEGEGLLAEWVKRIKQYRRILRKTVERSFPKWLSSRLNLWRLHRRVREKEGRHLHHEKPLHELPENIIAEYARDLTSFVQFLRGKHIVPVLSTFPTLITPLNKTPHEKLLLESRLVLSVELSADGYIGAFQKINQVIKRVAEKESLLFIDNDKRIPKTLQYFVDNIHYTDQGAELIARNIHDHLCQHGLIR